jgi:DNA-binding MarR family transcriptional regulator
MSHPSAHQDRASRNGSPVFALSELPLAKGRGLWYHIPEPNISLLKCSLLEISQTRFSFAKLFGSEIMENPTQGLYTDTTRKFLTVYRHLRRYSRQMHQEGISGRKLSALRYIFEAGPRTVGQIRDYLYVSDSGASELIARLGKMGYVTRTRSDTDNRVVIVDLTPAGRELAQKPPRGGISLLRERLQTLPQERLSVINEAMTEILTILEIDHDHS